MDTASEILDDLYLGFHPLATLFADNNAKPSLIRLENRVIHTKLLQVEDRPLLPLKCTLMLGNFEPSLAAQTVRCEHCIDGELRPCLPDFLQHAATNPVVYLP